MSRRRPSHLAVLVHGLPVAPVSLTIVDPTLYKQLTVLDDASTPPPPHMLSAGARCVQTGL